MTIIEPRKSRIKINYILLLLISSVVFGVLFNIYLYNQTVYLNYSLSEQQEILEDLRVTNAEFTNTLYQVLDFQDINSLADAMGLVKDNKPTYLQDQWQEFASRY